MVAAATVITLGGLLFPYPRLEDVIEVGMVGGDSDYRWMTVRGYPFEFFLSYHHNLNAGGIDKRVAFLTGFFFIDFGFWFTVVFLALCVATTAIWLINTFLRPRVRPDVSHLN